jgi:kynurenine formamidase
MPIALYDLTHKLTPRMTVTPGLPPPRPLSIEHADGAPVRPAVEA